MAKPTKEAIEFIRADRMALIMRDDRVIELVNTATRYLERAGLSSVTLSEFALLRDALKDALEPFTDTNKEVSNERT